MNSLKLKLLIFFGFLGAGLLLIFWASQKQTPTPSPSTKPIVITTVAPLTNIVANIGGDVIELHGLVPEGTDSHTFEPAPSDAQLLSKADLILVNGLHLETPTEKLAQANIKKTARIFRLGEATIRESEWLFDFSFPKDQGDPNPHLWMNPQYTKKYAELVRDQLITLDPIHTAIYTQRADEYIQRLDALDKGIETAVQTIPERNRKLLTYHDSWAYFARRYGMQVIGAVQPSDFKEPSPQDVARLIDQLKKEKVPALFGSDVFPSKILDQIARESGIAWVETLRDDDLPGGKNAPEHSYIGMMLEDVRHMVEPLGGSAQSLESLDPSNLK